MHKHTHPCTIKHIHKRSYNHQQSGVATSIIYTQPRTVGDIEKFPFHVSCTMYCVARSGTGTIVARSRACCATLHTVQRSMLHNTVRLHTLKQRLRSWCNCTSVASSTLFVASQATLSGEKNAQLMRLRPSCILYATLVSARWSHCSW